ncbi:MAG TPA: hypothetical protein VFW40_01915, partial [Capsulimonadaceae bacterium]|nr:hypothetical protein [Capsulimonadaceae bacterium]
METSCLQYRITKDEKKQFDETGILMIEDALSPAQVEALTRSTDKVYDRRVSEGHDPKTAMFYPNFIPEDKGFADLVDYEKI